MRYLVCLGVLILPGCAKGLTAKEVLDQVASIYRSSKAVHIIAVKEETRFAAGHAQVMAIECELANAPGGRYFALMKQPQQQALTINDGRNVWLALGSKKQWSRVSATSTGDSDEEHDAQAASRDLHDSLDSMIIDRFAALPKTLQNPVMAKPRDFELGHQKARCYTIRGHAAGTEIELLVDQRTFLVLRDNEKSGAPDDRTTVTINVKLVELNQEVRDSLFHFDPEPGWTEVRTAPDAMEPLRTGERAPGFTVKTLNGEGVDLQNLLGKVIVIDFWATWCIPCRDEFPALEKLRAEFGGAVRFYGVSDEDPDTVEKFVEENGYRMPILLDRNREMRRHYGVHKIPALVVIGPDSVVRWQSVGERSESELRGAIRAVLDQVQPNR
ncbi:MAG TPA: TlpA disulfide reductase family protein [Bryobacteraceae bacterium]|nr:TlpA disulfide reductase family protein [Bryobacteraceae bacterium]